MVTKPPGVDSIEDLGAFLLYGHVKLFEMLSDPKKAKALAPQKTIDPLIYALH